MVLLLKQAHDREVVEVLRDIHDVREPLGRGPTRAA
jgi:hypothetical protein